jgi:hypothetical protein
MQVTILPTQWNASFAMEYNARFEGTPFFIGSKQQ